MSELAFIVSDLHLGNSYFHKDNFLSWLDRLPAGAQLILNGDIIDDPDDPMPAAHQAVLDSASAVLPHALSSPSPAPRLSAIRAARIGCSV